MCQVSKGMGTWCGMMGGKDNGNKKLGGKCQLFGRWEKGKTSFRWLLKPPRKQQEMCSKQWCTNLAHGRQCLARLGDRREGFVDTTKQDTHTRTHSTQQTHTSHRSTHQGTRRATAGRARWWWVPMLRPCTHCQGSDGDPATQHNSTQQQRHTRAHTTAPHSEPHLTTAGWRDSGYNSLRDTLTSCFLLFCGLFPSPLRSSSSLV